MYDRDALMALFRERALKFGDFTLASGKKSTYYLDGKQITLHAAGVRLIGQGLLELLNDVEFDAIGPDQAGEGGFLVGFLRRRVVNALDRLDRQRPG